MSHARHDNHDTGHPIDLDDASSADTLVDWTQPDVVARLKQLLTPLAPSHIAIDDQSSAHRGHAGAREGGHFALLIVAEAFCGQSRLARQRSVMAAVKPLLRQGIHALSIVALTRAEYQTTRSD